MNNNSYSRRFDHRGTTYQVSQLDNFLYEAMRFKSGKITRRQFCNRYAYYECTASPEMLKARSLSVRPERTRYYEERISSAKRYIVNLFKEQDNEDNSQ